MFIRKYSVSSFTAKGIFLQKMVQSFTIGPWVTCRVIMQSHLKRPLCLQFKPRWDEWINTVFRPVCLVWKPGSLSSNGADTMLAYLFETLKYSNSKAVFTSITSKHNMTRFERTVSNASDKFLNQHLLTDRVWLVQQFHAMLRLAHLEADKVLRLVDARRERSQHARCIDGRRSQT